MLHYTNITCCVRRVYLTTSLLIVLLLGLCACRSTSQPPPPKIATPSQSVPIEPSQIDLLTTQLAEQELAPSKALELHTKLAAQHMAPTSFDGKQADHHNRQATLLWHQHHQTTTDPKVKKQMAYFASQALFQRGELSRTSMERISLAEPNRARFKTQFNTKNNLLKLAVEFYKESLTISTQTPGTHWPVANLVRMGQMTEHFGNALLEIKAPPTMSPAAKVLMRNKLINMRTPMLKLALQYYAQALRIKADEKTSKPWKLKAKQRLCALQPMQCARKTSMRSTVQDAQY